MADEHVQIHVSAPGSQDALNALAKLTEQAERLKRALPGGFSGGGPGGGTGSVPPGVTQPRIPAGLMTSPLDNALRQAHARATGSTSPVAPPGRPAGAANASGGMTAAMQSLLQSGSAAAVPLGLWLKENASILGGGSRGRASGAPSVPSSLERAMASNAGRMPQSIFADLLATSGPLPGEAGNQVRAIARRGVYGAATPSDLQALVALKGSTAGDLQAQVESLRQQKAGVQSGFSAGKYRTTAQQSAATSKMQGLDQKIGNLVASMSMLDEATVAAQSALAATGATRGPSMLSRIGASVGPAARTLYGVGRRVAGALGPVAGIASLGFVGASVRDYWGMANAAGASWARAGQPVGFNSYFNAIQSLGAGSGYTIPQATGALSALSLYSGNVGTPAGMRLGGTLAAARAMGIDPSQAGQLFGQIAAYGRVAANGSVRASPYSIGAAALGSGIDPRQYLTSLAGLVSTAGASGVNVSSRRIAGLSSSLDAFAASSGMSAFRGQRGASWLQSLQSATQTPPGGSSAEFIGLQAVRSAYAAAHPGSAPLTFSHAYAIQQGGVLNMSGKERSAYLTALQSRFKGMGTYGQLQMAGMIGMGGARYDQFYHLMHGGGGIPALSAALGGKAIMGHTWSKASVQAAAQHYMASPAGAPATAEATISKLTASIGSGLSPVVVQVTKDFGKLDAWLVSKLGGGQKGATNLAAGAVAVAAGGMLPSGPFGLAKLGGTAAIYAALGGGAPPAVVPPGTASIGGGLLQQGRNLIGVGGSHLAFSAGSRPAFIKALTPYAIQAASKTGLPASMILAQWEHESGAGRNPGTVALDQLANNFGGIKPWHKGQPVNAMGYAVFSNMQKYVSSYAATIQHNPRIAEARAAAAAGNITGAVEDLGGSGGYYTASPTTYAKDVVHLAQGLPGNDGWTFDVTVIAHHNGAVSPP